MLTLDIFCLEGARTILAKSETFQHPAQTIEQHMKTSFPLLRNSFMDGLKLCEYFKAFPVTFSGSQSLVIGLPDLDVNYFIFLYICVENWVDKILIIVDCFVYIVYHFFSWFCVHESMSREVEICLPIFWNWSKFFSPKSPNKMFICSFFQTLVGNKNS